MYFLNDQQDRLKTKCLDICKNKGHNNKTCRSKKINSCSNLKPQPEIMLIVKVLSQKEKIHM